MHFSQYENITGRPEYDVAAAASDRSGQLTKLVETLDGILYDGSQSTSDHQVIHYSETGVIASRTISYWHSESGNDSDQLGLEETTLRLWHEYDRWPRAERYRITTGWLMHRTSFETCGLKTSYSIDVSDQRPAELWIEQVDPADIQQHIGRQMTPYDLEQLQQLLDDTTDVLRADHADTVLANYLR